MSANKKLTDQKEQRPHISKATAWLRNPAFLCLLLALGTMIVFLPAIRNGFVDYDDPDYVTANSHVRGGLTWDNVVWAFETGDASNWHPLTWISHMLDYQLFRERAGAHHLVSVLFHVANTLLVFLLFSRMTGALWRSALLAAFFGLHPLHVESVAWVSERKDVLSAFFFLLTLWTYLKYVSSVECRVSGTEHGTRKKRPSNSAGRMGRC